MFAEDLLGELDFVLEFNLPKEISDNQDHIKLSVHRVEVPVVEIPVCPIGYKPRPIRTPGEIHCIGPYNTEQFNYIKEALPLINKWINSIYCTYNKLCSSRRNLLVDAKLYAYKKDHNLFKKWSLKEFHPLFNSNIEYFSDDLELIFRFENITDEASDESKTLML